MIKTLFVEDVPEDMTLILRSLKKEHLDIFAARVDSLTALEDKLEEKWDVILSDYNLRSFTALDVLNVVKKHQVLTPVIVVSSEVGDESAVELMRHGAVDFVRKENPSRLGPSILREIQLAQRKIQQDEQFRVLADSIPQLAWMSDTHGKTFWYNQKWHEYTGLTLVEMQSLGWEHLLVPELSEKILQSWRHSIATGNPWEHVFQMKSKTGSYRWFLSRALPLKDNHHDVTGWFGTSTDIDQQLKIEEELKTAKAEAEEANIAKSRFLANMSHEIRTPLGVMMGFADLALDQKKWNSEVEQYLSGIKRNGELLTQIIGDVLDLSKIEARKVEIDPMCFHLPSFLDEISSVLSLQVADKGIQLSFTHHTLQNEYVRTDPVRLRQILLNLVGNAIKFTSRGEVTVATEIEVLESSKQFLKFTIRDTGIGLSPDHQKKLFKPFSQADSSMTRKFGGSGLGLALSRELARALGGDIVIASSSVGVGSVFVCKVAFSEVTTSEAKPKSSLPSSIGSQKLAGLSILLVEDSKDNQVLISRYLQNSGAQVDFAGDGQLGVQMASERLYDLILMDIQMPVLNGHEATSLLRSSGYKKPIIALTAHAFKEERERAMQEGFSDYLTKPIHRGTLIESILRHTVDRFEGAKWMGLT